MFGTARALAGQRSVLSAAVPRDSQLLHLVPRPSQVPRQRRNMEALQLISDTLDVLIAKCKKLVRGTWRVCLSRFFQPFARSW